MTVCLPIRFDVRVSLTEEERGAVEELIVRCKAIDGFDPCIEFDTHLNADRSMPAWRLAWAGSAVPARADAQVLVGAACAFAPARSQGEISACVSPLFRQQGIFKALYEGLAEMLYRHGAESVLLVCDGDAAADSTIAERLGASLDHGEYLMSLPEELLAAVKAPDMLRLVPVSSPDLDEYAELSAAIFGEPAAEARDFAVSVLADGRRELFVARTRDGPVGTVAIATPVSGRAGAADRDSGAGAGGSHMVHGLGVLPAFRGQGWGGAILDASLFVLNKRGAVQVSLEVDAANGPALALYRSRGFIEQNRANYWLLPKDSAWRNAKARPRTSAPS